MQNLPLLTVPQLQVQPPEAGFGCGLPHSSQNLPALPAWPHEQVQPVCACCGGVCCGGVACGAGGVCCGGVACGAGGVSGLPCAGAPWPNAPIAPAPICPAMPMPMKPKAPPMPASLPAAVRIASAVAVARRPARMSGLLMIALSWISLMRRSSSSSALTDETPNETISMPRFLPQSSESSSLSSLRISFV